MIITRFITSVATMLAMASVIQAQEICWNDDGFHNSDYSYYDSPYSNFQDTYSTIDYSHNYSTPRSSSYGNWNRNDNRGYSESIRFGSRFDNSDNFSSGISSYQGTSTGPGPNGGYPGAPRGIYQTNYVDTSIYPNTYMQQIRR